MQLTQRCQYALRAMFELARHAEANPGLPGQVLPAGDIAKAQAIPKRFLDGILLELRQAGFVDARRGKAGGFFLTRPADSIRVGEVIRHYAGAMAPVDCKQGSGDTCPLVGRCVFMSLWDQARAALEQVYDAVTLAELVRRERALFPPPAA
jgi:Rrf2 family protein